ncbi:unnamed protein product, partial [Nesidiocoris tenuis]
MVYSVRVKEKIACHDGARTTTSSWSTSLGAARGRSLGPHWPILDLKSSRFRQQDRTVSFERPIARLIDVAQVSQSIEPDCGNLRDKWSTYAVKESCRLKITSDMLSTIVPVGLWPMNDNCTRLWTCASVIVRPLIMMTDLIMEKCGELLAHPVNEPFVAGTSFSLISAKKRWMRQKREEPQTLKNCFTNFLIRFLINTSSLHHFRILNSTILAEKMDFVFHACSSMRCHTFTFQNMEPPGRRGLQWEAGLAITPDEVTKQVAGINCEVYSAILLYTWAYHDHCILERLTHWQTRMADGSAQRMRERQNGYDSQGDHRQRSSGKIIGTTRAPTATLTRILISCTDESQEVRITSENLLKYLPIGTELDFSDEI